jgi:hypothetical protein
MPEAVAALRVEVTGCKKCPFANHTFGLCGHPSEELSADKGLSIAKFGRPKHCPLNQLSVFVVAKAKRAK